MTPCQEKLASSFIYQLFLRPFTPEGTLQGAMKMLPHLRSLGVDVVYLCPINEADDSMDPTYWSFRMKDCGFNNPRNPYRIKDFYKIDPEYGDDADLRAFVRTAHALGMRVLLDAVYRHSGPSCALITEHPEYYLHTEDGSLVAPEFAFPCFDYSNPDVREYFTKNMEYFVREFDVDGFRADCGSRLPTDFWHDAIARVRVLKPDLIMLNEGSSAGHLLAGFDIDYGCTWNHLMLEVAQGTKNAQDVAAAFQATSERIPEGKFGWRGLENHDFCNDAWENRVEKAAGSSLFECGLVLNFTGDGVPYIYCGNEICDVTRHSILGGRCFAPNARINWSNALTAPAKARMELIRTLAALRHQHAALAHGRTKYLTHERPEQVIAWIRENEGERILVAVNLSAEPQSITAPVPQSMLLSRGASYAADRLTLEAFGFLVCRL